MKEYTILAGICALGVPLLDYLLKTGLMKRKLFWYFHFFVLFMEVLTNGYLTWRPIVIYGESFFLNFRIGTIPIEDFFYGFGLISYNVILFEYFLKRKEESKYE